MISIHRWFFQTYGLSAPCAHSSQNLFFTLSQRLTQIWMIANTLHPSNTSISIIPLSDNPPALSSLLTRTQTSLILWCLYGLWIFCLPHLLHPHYSSYQTLGASIIITLPLPLNCCTLLAKQLLQLKCNKFLKLNAINFKLNAIPGLLWCSGP